MTASAGGGVPPHVTRTTIGKLLWDRQRDRLRGHRGRRVMPEWGSPQQLPEQRQSYLEDGDAILALIAGAASDVAPPPRAPSLVPNRRDGELPSRPMGSTPVPYDANEPWWRVPQKHWRRCSR
jgi:hypothetical protein